MSDWQTVEQLRERVARKAADAKAAPGPYLTISRQYGCSGMTLAILLAEILNDEAPSGQTWKVYGREVLEMLARETRLAADMVEDLRSREPRLMEDLFRSMFSKNVPTGFSIRNRIMAILRGLAFEGHVILVGQGSAGATDGIENGLNFRLEAPLPWRVQEICKRRGCAPSEAKRTMDKREKQRVYLRKIYAMRYPRRPAFEIVYDNSRFSLGELVRHIICMMRMRKFI